MRINYWDCKYNEYDTVWGEGMEEEIRIYGCSHPDNCEAVCPFDNKWGDDKDDCEFAEEEK